MTHPIPPTLGQSRVPAAGMTRKEICSWYDEFIPKLRSLRNVRNATKEFRDNVIEALLRFGFTRSHATLAEQWLELGRWHLFRAPGEIYVTDFLPSREQLASVGDVDVLIERAALKIVAAIARQDFIHREYVRLMMDEVRIETRQQVEAECAKGTHETWMLILRLNRALESANAQEKKRFSPFFHPKFSFKSSVRPRNVRDRQCESSIRMSFREH